MGRKKNSVKILMTSIALCVFVTTMNWVWGCQSVNGEKPAGEAPRVMRPDGLIEQPAKIGRASCRERVSPRV